MQTLARVRGPQAYPLGRGALPDTDPWARFLDEAGIREGSLVGFRSLHASHDIAKQILRTGLSPPWVWQLA